VTGTDSPEACALEVPSSRRFYVHLGSFGLLVAAQPSIFDEVAGALAISGASRALDQAVQDWAMLSPSGADPALAESTRTLHAQAADALRVTFQCVVQLVPSSFGATEMLLGQSERINAWCYEDGYLTYATDENAAAIMYAETGSLRQLRSQIRRSPNFDPALQMISGHSLFLFDQRTGTGPGTAQFYKKQATRLLRNFRGAALPARFSDAKLAAIVREALGSSVETFDGTSLADSCLRRGNLMVNALLRSLPTVPTGSASMVDDGPYSAPARTGGALLISR
jgi:hypothetical protein